MTMEDLRKAHRGEEFNGIENKTNNALVTVKNGISKEDGISAVHRVWGGDKRIALFGYTLETINLLLLPMIQTK